MPDTRHAFAVAVLVAVALLAMPAARVNAQTAHDTATTQLLPAEERLRTLLTQHSADASASLTIADITGVLDLVSIARQEREHVEASARLSWLIPGAGNIVNGDPVTGAVLMCSDVLLAVTTLVIADFLLPPAVHQSNLNYLQTSIGDIEERWKTVAPAELLPSIAALASGATIGIALRFYAARDAREAAVKAITEGVVRFEPEPLGGVTR